MITHRREPQSHIWLHRGSLAGALDRGSRIEETPGLGYVYLLALSNGHTKIGTTANFPRRLATHRSELRRYGLAVEHCLVTRPHFNYREIELATKRRFIASQVAGEVFDEPCQRLASYIEGRHLQFVAPTGFGRSGRAMHHLLNGVMAEISAALRIPRSSVVALQAQVLMAQHIHLGRETGLSERDSMLNALAVIEAHTGLELSAFRNVLAEAA